MECKLCKTEMKIGFAIEPRFHGNCRCVMAFNQTMTINDIKIIECWKCPECGYSDDGRI
jgi:hypothetical protein